VTIAKALTAWRDDIVFSSGGVEGLRDPMLDAEGNCLNGARHFGAPQLETALLSAFRHRSRLVPGG